ncbi:MAG: hypothetical protein QM731_12185 [Chitinophagaceae bacterium]
MPGDRAIELMIPTEFQHLLEQPAYEKMIGLVLNYFADKGEQVLSLKDGILTVQDEDQKELKYGLDNLVRMVAAAPETDWESLIYTHFNKVNFADKAYRFFFTDFEHARPHIKVLIKPEAILEYEFARGLVIRRDFPGTCTVLVFDYDGQFRFLSHDDVKDWQKEETVLFEEAFANIAREEVTVHKMEGENGLEIYSFFSGDFSAVKMIELERNAEFAQGLYGSIITIPTKGVTFASPVVSNMVMQQVEILAPLAKQFFEQNPGNITPDIYWYYRGRIQEFIKKPVANGYTSIAMPAALAQLLAST